MSMSEWTEEGYGMPLFNGDNLNNICDFIIKYDPEVNSEEMKKAPDHYVMADILNAPVPWKVAEIINRLEDTMIFKGFQENVDTDQEAMIGIQPVWPWESKDEDISKVGCDMLLGKYAAILGIKTEPEYFTAHYYG